MSREHLKPRKKMKYKHILSCVLSAVILGGGFQPVLAENTTSGNTEITYTVGESYVWTAPATINFTSNSNGSESKSAAINVTENTIGSGKTLKIGIASDQVFELVDSAKATNKRAYTVKDGSTALSAGSEVLSVDAGTNTAVKNLTIQMVNVATEIAGSYSGTLRFVSTIETSSISSNPYSAKVASVQKLYDVGEANLTDADIVTVNGVDCYVLQIEGNKAKLITVDIYDQRFDSAGSTCNYADSELKTYMDNFYTDQLGSDPYILDTTVTYRYKNSYSDDLSTYSTGTVSQKVFALDAVEAETNQYKFSWSYDNKMNGNGKSFWVAVGYGSSSCLTFYYSGGLVSNKVNTTSVGARPAFWISLSGENEPVNIISFTIGGIPYQAEDGMTWAEWVDSEYNTDGYRINNDSIVKIDSSLVYHVYKGPGSVDKNNPILSGVSYSLQISGGGYN